jgi:hypothetical protein
MAAPLNTCTTIEQRGVVRFLWAKNMEAKDIHKEMLPMGIVSIEIDWKLKFRGKPSTERYTSLMGVNKFMLIRMRS